MPRSAGVAGARCQSTAQPCTSSVPRWSPSGDLGQKYGGSQAWIALGTDLDIQDHLYTQARKVQASFLVSSCPFYTQNLSFYFFFPARKTRVMYEHPSSVGCMKPSSPGLEPNTEDLDPGKI